MAHVKFFLQASSLKKLVCKLVRGQEAVTDQKHYFSPNGFMMKQNVFFEMLPANGVYAFNRLLKALHFPVIKFGWLESGNTYLVNGQVLISRSPKKSKQPLEP